MIEKRDEKSGKANICGNLNLHEARKINRDGIVCKTSGLKKIKSENNCACQNIPRFFSLNL